MFAKFKNWVKHHQGAVRLTFNQQMDLISGRQYTIRQARFTDIPSIIRIEELIYGTAPWNANAFQIELELDRDRLYLVTIYDG